MSPELELAMAAAREAGALLRKSFEADLHVNEMHDHDIKLALDVESQKLIEAKILKTFPDHAIYGEEGIAGADRVDDTLCRQAESSARHRHTRRRRSTAHSTEAQPPPSSASSPPLLSQSQLRL